MRLAGQEGSRGNGREKTDAPVRPAYDRPMLIRLTRGPSAGRTWRVTLQRDELCVAVTSTALNTPESWGPSYHCRVRIDVNETLLH